MTPRTSRGEPPRLALRLLERLLPAECREEFVGDLLERHADARARGAGGPRLALRFWRETLVALVALRRPAPLPLPPSPVAAMHAFAADLRHGLRLLARSPLFTALCVLTLGLGIGATTAVVSVVEPVLLRALPYPDADHLALVWELDAEGETVNTSFATFADLARDARTLASAAAVGGWQPTVARGGEAERLTGQRVSWTFFRTLGVRPLLGRDFARAEDVPGANRVVVLGHGLWQRRFGADSAIVGRTVLLDDEAHLVVGVLPPTFESVLNRDAQIWRVLGYDASQPWACRTCRHLRMVARVRPDVAPEAAGAELQRLLVGLAAAHPRDYATAGGRVVGMQQEVTKRVRPVLVAVAGATALVLLLAVVNVANLQLARAVRRDEEFAIRAALGAGRGRLARQLLAEGLLLVGLGGAAGVLVARLALPALLANIPDGLPRLDAVRLDGVALLVAAAVTLTLGVVIGLLPALRGGRRALAGGLRTAGRVGGGRNVVRAGLVVSEVALALVLLVGAGLLSRSLVRLLAVDVGFDTARLLSLEVQATGAAYDSPEKVVAAFDRAVAAVAALPGVVAVGTTSQLPLSGSMDQYGIRAQDRPLANPALAPDADRYVVSPDLMRTLGVRVVHGRALEAADDRAAAEPVVVVSEALAAALWPGEDALGRRVQLGAPDTPWRRVVGVAGDLRHSGLDDPETNQIYVPQRQWPWANDVATLVVRTRGDPAALAATVRETVRRLDPSQPVTNVATMEQLVARSTAQRRLATVLFGAFAAIAVVLAAAGIYGVLAALVAERVREIGLRSALGATPGDIVRLVAAHGVRLAALGLAAGLLGALAVGRLLGSLLFDVRPADPATLVVVSAALLLVAAAACLAPVRRALRVQPMAALRAE